MDDPDDQPLPTLPHSRWIIEYGRRMAGLGDKRREELLYYAWRALNARETDPDEALTFFQTGRKEAEALREPWWILLFDHLMLQTVTGPKADYAWGRDIVVRAVVETRKPIYARFPQRICLHEDMIRIHVNIDPLGYAPVIEEAIAYMARELTPGSPCHECLLSVKIRFAIEMGRWDEAHELLLLALAEDRPDNKNLAADYTQISLAAYHRGDWEGLRTWAVEGEAIARRVDQPACVAESLLWQALLAQRDGDKATAQRHCYGALLAAKRGDRIPSREYYDTLCTFYSLNGDYLLACQARERELAGLRGKGQFASEAHAHIERCRLLARLGRSLEKALPPAREAVALLLDPAPPLAELDRIARGEIGLS